MYATALIIFREVLEIALIVGIVMAATRGLAGRAWMVLSGLGLGVVGSAIIALFVDVISDQFDGMGQEVLNAMILYAAVFMLGWTVIWMRQHGKEMATHLSQVGKQVASGDRPPYAIVFIVALATFREGAEIVLFTYGMLAGGETSVLAVIEGALLGLAGGTIVGFGLYFGLFKVLKKHLFTVTGWMLILLTAGLAAKGTSYLVAAGMVPELSPAMWDTSSVLDTESVLGTILEILIGYNPQPTGMELAVYLAVISILSYFYFIAGRKMAKPAAVVQV